MKPRPASSAKLPPLLPRVPPAVAALLLQGAAFALVLAGVNLTGVRPAPLTFALLCGLTAAIFSRLAGLARWWLLIQLVFVPALVLMLTLDIPPGFFLAAFLVMLAVYWSTFKTQVPLYLSSNKVWHELEGLLPAAQAGKTLRFMDLGCGLGGVLTHLAAARPDGHYSGVESAPLPALASWLRTRRQRNCAVYWGSIWDDALPACHLAQYDVVFAYLSPVPMERLWHKARAEMRPGSVFISSTFAVPDQQPDQTLSVDDLHHSTLLVWKM
ncbi:MAG: class I SAM-dependent methyltransferase [Gallionella sp.]|nr:class I SAM-dependent methyltransferase [Gallionella sp.]MDD4945608.1 class I SAM-dependent methyltransferase [Gallionella sp.]